MDRRDILHWFYGHPEASTDDPNALVDRCERLVRRHAREDAWLAAKRYVEERRKLFAEEWGAHASQAFVAIEVCRQLASELRHHAPRIVAGDEEHLAGANVRNAVGSQGWDVLAPWIRELAEDEERKAWKTVVAFTGHAGRDIVHEHHLSSDCDYDHARPYTETASRVAAILAHDYSVHAHPRA